MFTLSCVALQLQIGALKGGLAWQGQQCQSFAPPVPAAPDTMPPVRLSEQHYHYRIWCFPVGPGLPTSSIAVGSGFRLLVQREVQGWHSVPSGTPHACPAPAYKRVLSPKSPSAVKGWGTHSASLWKSVGSRPRQSQWSGAPLVGGGCCPPEESWPFSQDLGFCRERKKSRGQE